MGKTFIKRPNDLRGPEGVLTAVVWRCVNDATGGAGPEHVADARRYLASDKYDHHVTLLGLPKGTLPAVFDVEPNNMGFDFDTLEYLLLSDEMAEERAALSNADFGALLREYRRKKAERKRSREMDTTIDLAKTGTVKVEQEAAMLAKNDPKKLGRYIEQFGDGADKRLEELTELQSSRWSDRNQERMDKLLAEVEELRDVLEILERAKRGY